MGSHQSVSAAWFHPLISCVYQLIGSVSLVDFYCNLPSQSNTKLEFNCREPSCGALERDEKAAKLADDDYTVDPNFFDVGYSMAGSTGFKVGYHYVLPYLIRHHTCIHML